MILTISWGAVVKISIAAALIFVIKHFLRCVHDKFCFICKKSDGCCK